ncbi:hypothetical protein QFX18_19325 [Saccharophagus degradans]|uniref:hypothetical protein n=1 Tax=Saccharophagus degradans TaxID=86304 RepID=UPI002477DA80|nr:hypothetical protein [Saccharophagus degradans]WGO98162.1 hypothetical protein QFX18_19325 [Saccharophagus degradans]
MTKIIAICLMFLLLPGCVSTCEVDTHEELLEIIKKYEAREESKHEEVRRLFSEVDGFVEWSVARKNIVESCANVVSVYQSHSRTITVRFRSGENINTITPKLDDIISTLQTCRGYEFHEIDVITE